MFAIFTNVKFQWSSTVKISRDFMKLCILYTILIILRISYYVFEIEKLSGVRTWEIAFHGQSSIHRHCLCRLVLALTRLSYTVQYLFSSAVLMEIERVLLKTKKICFSHQANSVSTESKLIFTSENSLRKWILKKGT